MTRNPWTSVRRYVHEVAAEFSVPAIVVAATDRGAEVLAEATGVRQVGAEGAAFPDMVFGIASVTKGITALATMQLVEAGRLSLDDPVTRYLPAYRTTDDTYTRATTVHHLLTHTAGLPPLASRYFAVTPAAYSDPPARPAWVADHTPLASVDDLLSYLADQDIEPLGAPGEWFSYSNEGYVMLGAIIEIISGQSYVDYVHEHILRPLGMEHSSFDRAALAGRTDVAVLHARHDSDGSAAIVPDPESTHAEFWHPAGGLNSTVRDLLRYLEIFRTGGLSGGACVLSAEGIEQMMAPHAAGGDPGAHYGYGFIVRRDYHGRSMIHHGGGRKGISAHVVALPEHGLASVALGNLAGIPSERLALAPINHLLGLPLTSTLDEYEHVTYTTEQMSRYVGTFRGGEDTQLTATLDGKALLISVDGETVATQPVGADGFLLNLRRGPAYACFLGAGGGPAWAVAFGKRILRRVDVE